MSDVFFAGVRAPPDHVSQESPTQPVEHQQEELAPPTVTQMAVEHEQKDAASTVTHTAVKHEQKDLIPSTRQGPCHWSLEPEPIVQRFRDNGLDTAEVVQACNSYDHDVLMKLPPSKVRIAKFANSTLDDAFEMRFMCTSLQEFVDLATYGSMDDVKRVYLSLAKRIEMQTSMLKLADIGAYGGHPALGMHDGNNPEYDTVKSAYELMTSRAKTYST